MALCTPVCVCVCWCAGAYVNVLQNIRVAFGLSCGRTEAAAALSSLTHVRPGKTPRCFWGFTTIFMHWCGRTLHVATATGCVGVPRWGTHEPCRHACAADMRDHSKTSACRSSVAVRLSEQSRRARCWKQDAAASRQELCTRVHSRSRAARPCVVGLHIWSHVRMQSAVGFSATAAIPNARSSVRPQPAINQALLAAGRNMPVRAQPGKALCNQLICMPSNRPLPVMSIFPACIRQCMKAHSSPACPCCPIYPLRIAAVFAVAHAHTPHPA